MMQMPPHLLPNMMGGMFTVPLQMWMQPPAAPAQTGAMEVNDDMPQPRDNKYSLSKGKKKASESFTRQQRAQEAEENLDRLL